MRMPLILEADDGFYFFGSREAAEGWMEAIDIENGEYRVFDADGIALVLEPSPKGCGTISWPAEPVSRREELTPLLQDHFKRIGVSSREAIPIDFDGMVDLGAKRFLERGPESFAQFFGRLLGTLFPRTRPGGGSRA